MSPKYRMWNRITSKLHHVTGLYFDSKEVQYTDEFGILRFIKFKNIILMLSTGLKDKNGKEIFEGDIIRYNIDVVDIKRHPTLGFYTVLDGREGFFGDGMSIDDFEEDVKEFSKTAEIIGNIYENPELLEVTE